MFRFNSCEILDLYKQAVDQSLGQLCCLFPLMTWYYDEQEGTKLASPLDFIWFEVPNTEARFMKNLDYDAQSIAAHFRRVHTLAELMDDSQVSSSRVLCPQFENLTFHLRKGHSQAREQHLPLELLISLSLQWWCQNGSIALNLIQWASLHQIPYLVTKPVDCHNFTYWLNTRNLDIQTYKAGWMVFIRWKIYRRGVGMLAFYLCSFFFIVLLCVFLLVVLISCIVGCALSMVRVILSLQFGERNILMKFKLGTNVHQATNCLGFPLEVKEEHGLQHWVCVQKFSTDHFYKWSVAIIFASLATQQQWWFFVGTRLEPWMFSCFLSFGTLLLALAKIRSICAWVFLC